jgi:hypothetical protein
VETKTQEVIASYITDMIALEEHMQKAFAGQLADLKTENLASVLRQLNDTSTSHSRALRALADEREQGGQGIAEVVKKAASSVLGVGAAAIDFVRSEKLPKNLRDDYTAVSLASVGYLMLHTTALALSDGEVARLAYSHLQGYATASMTLFNVIPEAVVDMLREDGYTVDDAALEDLEQNIENIWTQDEKH